MSRHRSDSRAVCATLGCNDCYRALEMIYPGKVGAIMQLVRDAGTKAPKIPMEWKGPQRQLGGG